MKVTSKVLPPKKTFNNFDSTLRGVVRGREGWQNVVAAKRQQPGKNFMTLAFQLLGESLNRHQKIIDAFPNAEFTPNMLQVGVRTNDWLLYDPTKIFVNHNTVFENGAVCPGEIGDAFGKFGENIQTLLRLIKDIAHLDRPISRSPEEATMKAALSGDDGIIISPDEFATDTRGVQSIAGLLQSALQKIKTGSK